MTGTKQPRTPLKNQLQFLGVALLGVVLLLYPMTANWFSQLNQAELLDNYHVEVDDTTPPRAQNHLG